MSRPKKTVLKSLAMITQLGIMVITPTALCVALGLFIDHLAGTNWIFLPWMALGMVAGITSVYKMVMKVVRQDEAEKTSDPITEKLLASLKEPPSYTRPEPKQESSETHSRSDA